MDRLFKKVFNNIVIRKKIFGFLKLINNYKSIEISDRDLNKIKEYRCLEFVENLRLQIHSGHFGYNEHGEVVNKDTFPSYVTFETLDLVYSNIKEIKPSSIPNCVTDLRLPVNYNEKLLGTIYPNKLKKLTLNYDPWDSEHKKYSMKCEILPPTSLEFLKIHYSSQTTFKRSTFKISKKATSIHTLELICYGFYGADGTLDCKIFPPNITKLVLDCSFINIDKNAFSKTRIKELIFLYKFDDSLVFNKFQFPSSLEILKLSGKKTYRYSKIDSPEKDKTFEIDSLPINLKKFIVTQSTRHLSIYCRFNQLIETDNFFPISCTEIYLKDYDRPITINSNNKSIFHNNLKVLEFNGIFFNQQLFTLPNSISYLSILSYNFNQPLCINNCLPQFLVTLNLNYSTYYLNILNGSIKKIKWLPISLKNLLFIDYKDLKLMYCGSVCHYINDFKTKKDVPFEHVDLLVNLDYLSISNVYYKN